MNMANKLSLIALIFGSSFIFGMEQPQALGQPIRQRTAIKAIKECCCDRGYCISCGLACAFCCEASLRYVGYTLLVYKHFTQNCFGKNNYHAVRDIIHSVESTQIIGSAFALIGINSYYLRKHFKIKKD